jgi:glucokinase
MSKNVLALDLGGSKFIVGIVDEEGNVLAKERFLWKELTKEAVMDSILEAVKSFRETHNEECVAIGVTIPGLADPEKGIWIEASFSMIRNLPIAELLTKEFGLPTFVDNDVNACAIAEKRFGCCKDTRDFAWITVSNGIGGALYLNNDIYYGAFGNAGEIGHFTVVENGRACNCGSSGCLEMHAAGPAILKNYEEMTGESKTAAELAEMAKSGDKNALAVSELEGKYLGMAVAAIANIMNPKKVVFGGGVMESFDLIEASMKESYKKNVYFYANRALEIEHTGLGYYAALLGAAAVAFRRIERE